jgi:serine/threonine-protein kinase
MTAPASLTSALAERYAFENELGRGGMATVYLATDRKHDRRVAIKVLHPDLTRSVGAERFLREIRIAAQLAHPHILPLIDSGEAGGVLYYVTPYVPGGSLRDRLTRPLALDEALRILREVGAALDYAHRQGFVHRDVKPENILFAEGLAVLADFGIARACCGPGAEAVTEIGLALGTPEYMSPEQVAGERDLSGRSDLYSLATVAFEMLAGAPPLKGDGARATMARQITDAPPPLRAFRPDAPSAVERALARALAKDPAGRYDTVTDFLAALEAPGHGGAAAAERSLAVLPFVNIGGDPSREYLSDGLTDELINALAAVEGLRVASRTSVFGYKGRAEDVRSIGAKLGASWVLEGTVRTAGARLRVTAQLTSTETGQLAWSQRFDRTVDDVFALQDEIARSIVAALRGSGALDLPAPARRPPPRNPEAYELYLRGRYAWNQRTRESIAQAMEFFERAVAADPSYAPSYAGLADAWALQLDYRAVPVEEGFRRARDYARRALALDETLAEAHASLAWTLFIYDWDWAASGAEFRRAIELDPGYASAHQWYAFWLAAHGRFPAAIAAGHRAAELDPASVSIRRGLGWLYYYARRYDEAQHHLGRAVLLNPLTDETRRVQGLAFAMQGRWAEAEDAFRRALALSGAGSYNEAMLGWLLGRTGRRAEAEAVRSALVERAATEYVSPVALATVSIGVGENERALDEIERALAERRGWLAYLKVNPIADPLRGHPRFESLLTRMRLTD